MEIGKAAAKTKLQALTAEQDKLTSNFSSHTTHRSYWQSITVTGTPVKGSQGLAADNRGHHQIGGDGGGGGGGGCRAQRVSTAVPRRDRCVQALMKWSASAPSVPSQVDRDPKFWFASAFSKRHTIVCSSLSSLPTTAASSSPQVAGLCVGTAAAVLCSNLGLCKHTHTDTVRCLICANASFCN